MTTRRLLDSDEALRRLETRLGPLHAQLRLGMEREHEAQAFGQGLSFLHLENLPLMQAMIEIYPDLLKSRKLLDRTAEWDSAERYDSRWISLG